MVADRHASRRWVDQGSALFAQALDSLDEEAFAGPSALPGWSRKHVAAHLAVNAGALANLVLWAATGVERRMYAAPDFRTLQIETGASRSAAELKQWCAQADAELVQAMDALTADQWRARVVSLQEKDAPAAHIPWVRAREVLVHTVDLDAGVAFADLPRDFLAALCEDVVVRRDRSPRHPALRLAADDVDSGVWTIGAGAHLPAVRAPLAQLAAYLTGRTFRDVHAQDGGPPPPLPPWL